MAARLAPFESPSELRSSLEHVVHYYPSGTTHQVGSPTERMVEASRRMAVRAIVGELKKKTGKDLGDDPQEWIRQK